MSAIYRGQLVEGGFPGTVTVTRDGRTEPLEHHVRHSPSGFGWGYAGSGPADLARALLWDHLGEEPHPAAYQALKFAIVAHWPHERGWELRSEAIDEWLQTYRANGGEVWALDAVDRMAQLEMEAGFDQEADDPEPRP